MMATETTRDAARYRSSEAESDDDTFTLESFVANNAESDSEELAGWVVALDALTVGGSVDLDFVTMTRVS